MTRADIEQFNKERDEAVKNYDVQKFREFYLKWTFKGAYAEVAMRKMVYHLKSSTAKERLDARRWLEDHGCTTEL